MSPAQAEITYDGLMTTWSEINQELVLAQPASQAAQSAVRNAVHKYGSQIVSLEQGESGDSAGSTVADSVSRIGKIRACYSPGWAPRNRVTAWPDVSESGVNKLADKQNVTLSSEEHQNVVEISVISTLIHEVHHAEKADGKYDEKRDCMEYEATCEQEEFLCDVLEECPNFGEGARLVLQALKALVHARKESWQGKK